MRTVSRTAARTSSVNCASSTDSPASRASTSERNRPGRGRLPECVVKTRPVPSCIETTSASDFAVRDTATAADDPAATSDAYERNTDDGVVPSKDPYDGPRPVRAGSGLVYIGPAAGKDGGWTQNRDTWDSS